MIEAIRTNDFFVSTGPAFDSVTGSAPSFIAGSTSNFIASFAPGFVVGPIFGTINDSGPDSFTVSAPSAIAGHVAFVVIDPKTNFFYSK